VQTLRRARHSLFTTQLHQMYAFGRARIGADGAKLCRQAGRAFAERVVGDNLHPLLAIARAQPGQHQAALVTMIEAYLARYAGSTYALSCEASAKEVELTLRYRDVAGTRERDAARGLDPDDCFRDSAEFIAGAMEAFARRAISQMAPDDCDLRIDGESATIRLPVRRDADFAYPRLPT